MLVRLKRLLSATQSPGSMLEIGPAALWRRVVVSPNISWASSSSWRLSWSTCCVVVSSAGMRALRVVGERRADAAGQVAAVRRVARVRAQHAAADARRRVPRRGRAVLGVPVGVVDEDERDRHARALGRAVDRAVLGIRAGDRERDGLPEREEVTVERRVDRQRRRRVADRDDRARRVATSRSSPSPSAGPCRPRWRCRRDVGFGAVESTVPLLSKSQANVIESPGSSSREPALLNCDGQRRPPVRRRGADDGARPLRALRVLPPVHAGVGVRGEEAVAVGEQVEVPVGPELQVHRVVALERERRRR